MDSGQGSELRGGCCGASPGREFLWCVADGNSKQRGLRGVEIPIRTMVSSIELESDITSPFAVSPRETNTRSAGRALVLSPAASSSMRPSMLLGLYQRLSLKPLLWSNMLITAGFPSSGLHRPRDSVGNEKLGGTGLPIHWLVARLRRGAMAMGSPGCIILWIPGLVPEPTGRPQRINPITTPDSEKAGHSPFTLIVIDPCHLKKVMLC